MTKMNGYVRRRFAWQTGLDSKGAPSPLLLKQQDGEHGSVSGHLVRTDVEIELHDEDVPQSR